jgi:hypothetical protein
VVREIDVISAEDREDRPAAAAAAGAQAVLVEPSENSAHVPVAFTDSSARFSVRCVRHANF